MVHPAALITFSIKMMNEAEDGEPVQNKELERASSLNFLRYLISLKIPLDLETRNARALWRIGAGMYHDACVAA